MLNEIFNLEKFLEVCNYVFWFFTLNLLFWILNIPLILFFMFLGISQIFNYLPLFLVCLIPVMPSFCVILYCVNKIYKEKNISIIKDFSKGFKLNFAQALNIWCIELLLIFMVYSNLRFFSRIANNLIMTSLFICILIIIITVTPYLFLLISRFSMKNMQIVRLAFILMFTRPIISLTNLLVGLFFMVIFELNPAIVILFISTALAFVLIFVNRELLKQLESISKNVN